MVALVVIPSDLTAGSDSLSWWLEMVIILGVLTILSVAVVYAQRRKRSVDLYTEPNALPYAMSHTAETSMHMDNSQIMYTGMEFDESQTSIQNPYFTAPSSLAASEC